MSCGHGQISQSHARHPKDPAGQDSPIGCETHIASQGLFGHGSPMISCYGTSDSMGFVLCGCSAHLWINLGTDQQMTVMATISLNFIGKKQLDHFALRRWILRRATSTVWIVWPAPIKLDGCWTLWKSSWKIRWFGRAFQLTCFHDVARFVFAAPAETVAQMNMQHTFFVLVCSSQSGNLHTEQNSSNLVVQNLVWLLQKTFKKNCSDAMFSSASTGQFSSIQVVDPSPMIPHEILRQLDGEWRGMVGSMIAFLILCFCPLIHSIPLIPAGLVGSPVGSPENSHTTEMMCWVAGRYSQCPLDPKKYWFILVPLQLGVLLDVSEISYDFCSMGQVSKGS